MVQRLLCFGDSNTYGYDPRSFFGDRYPKEDRWTGILDSQMEWTILNAGQNGREIPTHPDQIAQVRALLELERPDCLLVMLGSNDLLAHAGFTAEDAAARMEQFLKQLPKQSTLLIAPPAMAPGAWVTEERLVTESIRLAECFRALAARLGIYFADASAWHIPLAYDGVHFTEAGHHLFAQKLSSCLTELFF